MRRTTRSTIRKEKHDLRRTSRNRPEKATLTLNSTPTRGGGKKMEIGEKEKGRIRGDRI